MVIFYNTPFREHIEEYFFDVRTKLKPQSKYFDDIVLIDIDQNAIANIEGKVEGKQVTDLSLAGLIKLLKMATHSNASQIAVLFLANIFDYSDKEMPAFSELVNSDPRILLGTLGYNSAYPSILTLPKTMSSIQHRVFGIETLKKRSNSIVRQLPFGSFRGQIFSNMLWSQVATNFGYFSNTTADVFYLNYWNPDQYPHIRADQFLTLNHRELSNYKDKVIIIGYSIFRPWMIQSSEQMLVNTPLTGNPDNFLDGENIAYLTANATENLIHNHQLKPVNIFWQSFHVLIISIAFGLVWKFGSVLASIFIFHGWLIILLTHAFLFEYFNIFIPLADTAVISTLCILTGALYRLNSEIKNRAQAKADAEAKQELAVLHGRYLNRFAFEISQMNDEILKQLKSLLSLSNADKTLLNKASASCEEFTDYLAGIKNFAAVDDLRFTQPNYAHFELLKLIQNIISRFDASLQEKSIKLSVNCPKFLQVNSNREIIDTIIFNFISNAIKYSPERTKIEITVSLQKKDVKISVSDHGPGIERQYLDVIFEKFYRIKNETVFKVKGTGLGLYFCKYFAEKINATIEAQSTVGKGSTFSLLLRKVV